MYKNIFDKNKFVEFYDYDLVKKDLGLDREGMIKLALFLGSDYTTGVRGIGPVNAIEIINVFRDTSGLQKFRDWVRID